MCAYRYIFNVIEMARTNPGLYLLLNIHGEAKKYRDEYHRVERIEGPTKSCDIDCQTDVHPIVTNINKDYTWNVWNLRRKAIQLANLRKCQTHSTQTDCSYERFATRTQTWPLKSSNCQTKHDAAVNVPRPHTCVRYGRGVERSTAPEQINLTCPVEDQLVVECLDSMATANNIETAKCSKKTI